MTREPHAAQGVGRRQLQQIMAHLSEGVILLDPDGAILWANRAALDMHGCATQQDLANRRRSTPAVPAARIRRAGDPAQPQSVRAPGVGRVSPGAGAHAARRRKWRARWSSRLVLSDETDHLSCWCSSLSIPPEGRFRRALRPLLSTALPRRDPARTIALHPGERGLLRDDRLCQRGHPAGPSRSTCCTTPSGARRCALATWRDPPQETRVRTSDGAEVGDGGRQPSW